MQFPIRISRHRYGLVHSVIIRDESNVA